MKTNSTEDNSTKLTNDLNSQKFYHGTKASLKRGDLIESTGLSVWRRCSLPQ